MSEAITSANVENYEPNPLWPFAMYHFLFILPPTGHGCPFKGGLLLLLLATPAREPIPAPGGRRQG